MKMIRMTKWMMSAIAGISMTTATFAADAPAVVLPDDATMAAQLARFDLVYTRPDGLRGNPSALPLGNGLIGATMQVQTRLGVRADWLADNCAKWDTRGGIAPVKEAFRLQIDRQDAFAPYGKDFKADPKGLNHRYTFGDMVLNLRGAVSNVQARLDLWNAVGTVRVSTTAGTVTVRSFIAEHPDVIVIHRTATGGEAEAATWNYEAPDYTNTGGDWKRPWDKGDNITARREGAMEVRTNPNDSGGERTIVWHEQKLADGSQVLMVSLKMSKVGPSLDEPLAQVTEAVKLGVDALQARHREKWHGLWRRHYIHFPDSRIANLYWLGIYRFCAQFRPDGPISDNSGLWPWRLGSWPLLTMDFNGQAQVSPGVAANLADRVQPMVNTVNRNLRSFLANARNIDGYTIAMQREPNDNEYSVHGNRLQDLPPITIDDIPKDFSASSNLVERFITRDPSQRPPSGLDESISNMAHLLWEYHRYYRSTMDEKAGRRLYKLAKMNMRGFLYRLGAKQSDGKYHLGHFALPERGAPLDSAYGLSAINMLCRVIMELDDRWHLNDPDRKVWEDVLANLAPYPVWTGDLSLRKSDIGRGIRNPEMETVKGSAFVANMGQDIRDEEALAKWGVDGYRHWTHLYQVYPYHVIDEEKPESRSLIRNSIRLWDGMDPWSQGVRAALWCALGEGENARDTYIKRGAVRAWIFSSGGPLIETHLLCTESIQNFFLQSHWGLIRVFPAIPADWADVNFHQMRAQGAFLVSAKRSAGKTAWVLIQSEAGEPCRVRTDLARPIEAVGSRPFAVKELANNTLEIDLKKGETVLLKTKGTTPDLTIKPVADDGWVNWFPEFYDEKDKASRAAAAK